MTTCERVEILFIESRNGLTENLLGEPGGPTHGLIVASLLLLLELLLLLVLLFAIGLLIVFDLRKCGLDAVVLLIVLLLLVLLEVVELLELLAIFAIAVLRFIGCWFLRGPDQCN